MNKILVMVAMLAVCCFSGEVYAARPSCEKLGLAPECYSGVPAKPLPVPFKSDELRQVADALISYGKGGELSGALVDEMKQFKTGKKIIDEYNYGKANNIARVTLAISIGDAAFAYYETDNASFYRIVFSASLFWNWMKKNAPDRGVSSVISDKKLMSRLAADYVPTFVDLAKVQITNYHSYNY